MEEGDRNKKFFHKTSIYNRSQNKMINISNHLGECTTNPSKIADTFVTHFQNLLNHYEGSNKEAQSKLLTVIPNLVSAEDNNFLNRSITLEEVRMVVFSMNHDKAQGPDGFQVFFFQKCWDIVGEDLWKAIEGSRKGGALLSEINYILQKCTLKTYLN